MNVIPAMLSLHLALPLIIAISIIFCSLTLLTNERKMYNAIEVALFGIAAIISFIMLWQSYSGIFLHILQANAFSELLFGSLAFGAMLVLLLTVNAKQQKEMRLLMSLVLFGIFMVSFAYSVLAIIIGLETVIIATVFMILSNGKRYIEPAMKLFILGAISTGLFVAALALLLPYNPSLSITTSLTQGAGRFIIGLSLVLFAAALAVETGAFPFNLWIPDVYDGSPGNITALMAGINKKVAFVAVLEIFIIMFSSYGMYGNGNLVSTVFFVLSIFTMFFGNLIALIQKNVKKMFAYSSISQAGYIFIGISAATKLGIEGSIFYIIAHMLMIIGAFSIVFWLESNNIKNIDEYGGLKDRNPFAAVALTILMLSMAGIPPLIGFAGKFILFSSAVYSNDILLAVIGIINSFISIYYYAKVINQMFQKRMSPRIQMPANIAAVVAICTILVIIIGIYPQILLGPSYLAAAYVI
jgi:NADH-quinone oxidoreductase subunit N